MKLLVLTKDHSKVVAVRDISELPAALASVPWRDLDLARTNLDAFEGYPPPPLAPSDFIDRSNPDLGVASGVTVVAKIDFYRRCSEAEASAIQAMLADTGAKMAAIFAAAITFRSDAPEWLMLQDAATALFGADRAAVLLAPSA